MIEGACYFIQGRCDGAHPIIPKEFDANGETLAECKRQLRNKGWAFRRSGKVYCPGCAKHHK